MNTLPNLSLTFEELTELANASGLDLNLYNPGQIMKGMGVELEHGVQNPKTDVTHNDALQTLKIVLAHLDEKANYYDELEKIEKPLNENVMSIHDIADQLVKEGSVSSEDFEIVNNEIVPKDAYTLSFMQSAINELGFETIEQGGNLLLTGEASLKNDLNEEIDNPISFAMVTIDRLKNAQSKEQAESIFGEILKQPSMFDRKRKAINWILTTPEAKDVIKVTDNVYATTFLSQLEGKPLTEVKDIPGNAESIRMKSDIRRLLEELVNKTEDTLFTMMDYKDNEQSASSYIHGLQAVLASLNVLKTQASSISKPPTPQGDF